MNIERLKNQIIESEGLKYKAYKDHLGNWTIGVGHLVKLPDEEYLLRGSLKEYEVMQIFTTDLNQAIDDARKFIDQHSINDTAFEVVIDMAFNLGYPRLSKFVRFQKALIDNDYILASQEMLDSLWAKQLPNRSQRLAKIMRDA